jgi:methionine-rich copper-binding protein CopC
MPPRRALMAALVSLAAALTAATPSAADVVALPAHAQLVSTDPADGDTRDTVAEVTLTFSEEVNAKFVQVQVDGPSGDEADGAPATDGPVVTQALVPDLPSGEHTVVYRVVSVDGHPVSGTFSFTTTDGPSESPSPTTSPSEATSAAGTTTSPPAVSSPEPSVSAAPTSTSSPGTPGWLVPVLIGLVVLVLLAGGFLLARPRRGRDEAATEGPPDELR